MSAPTHMHDNVVLDELTRILCPFIVVFGVYVITHGEVGPGGGFQGGVIIASSYILYALVHGVSEARKIVPRWLSDTLGAMGVVFYAGVGVATLALGGGFLDYDVLNEAHPAHGQTLGMTLVELGVGLTVAFVMITLFTEMVEE